MKRTIQLFAVLIIAVTLGSTTLIAQQPKTFPRPSAAVASTQQFAGTWQGTYSSNVVQPTKVTLIFQQFGATVTGTYLSANGAQGVMFGTASSAGLSATANQTTPTCTGQFAMTAQISGSTMTWTFVGQDCLGAENGKGSATKK